jgi:hypothetical protein
LRLVTEGDLPEEDWKFLYAQDKSGVPYEEFKGRMRKEAPAYATTSSTSTKRPPTFRPILAVTETGNLN